MSPDRELDFISQSEVFLKSALQEYGVAQLEDLPMVSERPPSPLMPILISDFRKISIDERATIRREYESEYGVAHLVVRNPKAKTNSTHPLFDIVNQLKKDLALDYPLRHPLEGHPEAVARFGEPDGTVKIYDLPIPAGSDKYREQAETSEFFALHHDGLGSQAESGTLLTRWTK